MKPFIAAILTTISLLFTSCSKSFKDSYGSSANGRVLKLGFKDSYGGSSGRRTQIGFKDSYGGGAGRRIQHGFKDSYGSGGNNGRRSQLGFRDSFGGNGGVRQVKTKSKDSYGTKRKSKYRGYKDPDKEWWDFFGLRRRQGKAFKDRKAYTTKVTKKTIPKKKKKVNRTTKFEGAK